MIDLKTILSTLEEIPPVLPDPLDASWAIINDSLRDVGVAAMGPGDWKSASKDGEGAQDRLAYLAWLIAATPLGAQLAGTKPQKALKGPRKLIAAFLDETCELDLDALNANRFRREEFLRKWLEAVGAPIEGETDAISKDRLSRVDSLRLRKLMAQQERDIEEQKKKWQDQIKERAQAETRSSYE